MIYNVSLDALATVPLDEEKEVENDSVDGKYVFGIVKVGERGQVVIPKHARNVYKIEAGDKLLVVGDHRGIALAKLKGLMNFSFGE